MDTEEHVRYIARKVAERVRDVSPPGLGHWDGAWELVAEPSDAFLDALHEWAEEDTEKTRVHVTETANALVGAWAKAAARYEAEGRPDSREEVPA